LKFSIAHRFLVDCTNLLVRSAGSILFLSFIPGILSIASLIPQSGQISVLLSTLDNAGRPVYGFRHLGHTTMPESSFYSVLPHSAFHGLVTITIQWLH
jgi:hypothetical protein